MLEMQPIKTFRGTWDEVASHRDEIPSGAVVEVKVYEPKPDANEEIGDFGGKNLAEVFGHLFGTVHGGPSDVAAHPEKYMHGFGETKDRRSLTP